MGVGMVNPKVWVQTAGSDQISRLVVSDSLRPDESQHARLPCPSPTPGVHSDSRPVANITLLYPPVTDENAKVYK